MQTALPTCLIGLFLLLVWGAWDLFGQRRQVVLAALASLVLLVCVFLTRRQVGYWADSQHLWNIPWRSQQITHWHSLSIQSRLPSERNLGKRPITTPARPCGSCRPMETPIMSRAKSTRAEVTGRRRRLPSARRLPCTRTGAIIGATPVSRLRHGGQGCSSVVPKLLLNKRTADGSLFRLYNEPRRHHPPALSSTAGAVP